MTKFLKISGCDNPNRKADLIFVHGVDGDARTTWQQKDKPETFWPYWLGQDFRDLGVWSLDYDSSALAWRGDTMPLYDRADNVLDLFNQKDIGKRPIGFVCHSLGGLLIKQFLRNALDSKNSTWLEVAKNTRFIVFLSTPHSGSNMANWIQYAGIILRPTVSVKELKAHDPQLRQLNTWYRNHVADLNIDNFVYCEERKTGRVVFGLGGILVVDKVSADPGIPNVTPISLDEDHISICKPVSTNKEDYRVYGQVKKMTEKLMNESVQQVNGTVSSQAQVKANSIESAAKKQESLQQPTVSQTHNGTGDNIAGNQTKIGRQINMGENSTYNENNSKD